MTGKEGMLKQAERVSEAFDIAAFNQ